MIKLQIIKEIQRRMPWILTTYGGIETFISYIKEALKIDETDSFNSLTLSQKSDLFNFLTLLIKYEKDILLISPWNLFIDLRQNINNTTTKDTINIDYPYQVFKLNGDLIYTVKTHFGVYGESRLDKHLILNSVNASGYFLKYRNYQGVQKIKLFAGDYIAYTDQQNVRFLIETLEPEAIDSYFNWNFFDATLGQKEYFSDYVFEDTAAEYLKQHPETKAQLEEKRNQDKAFADNPEAQLEWIYKNWRESRSTPSAQIWRDEIWFRAFFIWFLGFIVHHIRTDFW